MVTKPLLLAFALTLFGCGESDPATTTGQDASFDARVVVDGNVGDASETSDAMAVDAAGACFARAVHNEMNPNAPGAGISSQWSYGGLVGLEAGQEMCGAVGADHVCTYSDLVVAEAAGELDALPKGTTFWLYRLVAAMTANSTVPAPIGSGGRCNNWTVARNDIVEGEFGTVSDGAIRYNVDGNTCFTADPADNCVDSEQGLPCAGVFRAILCCSTNCPQ